MTNNDILRRIRYAFDFNDAKMMALFALADHSVSRQQISAWLKKDDDPALVECKSSELALFLNGLINDRRGKKEGAQSKPGLQSNNLQSNNLQPNHLQLNNNIIFRKLRIALNLKDDDILSILRLAGFPLSKPELSAFFRKSESRQFRVCKDQVLRNFIKGLQLKYRPDKASELAPKWKGAVHKKATIQGGQP